MKLSLASDDLIVYVQRQVSGFFPDGEGDGLSEVGRFVGPALERMEACVSQIGAKGYRDADGPVFSHRHTDQYATFLYFLANTAHRLAPGHPLAEKFYALNKALHGLDAFYEVALPDVFLLMHPVGTILGRATYADYFCCYQNVTVGSNLKGESPVFGEGVVLYGGARVIGSTRLGANTMVSTGAIAIDRVLPANAIIFGVSPNNTIKPHERWLRADLFRAVGD